jgi:hypothetical protein
MMGKNKNLFICISFFCKFDQLNKKNSNILLIHHIIILFKKIFKLIILHYKNYHYC